MDEIRRESSRLFPHIDRTNRIWIDKEDIRHQSCNGFQVEFAVGLTHGETKRTSPDDSGKERKGFGRLLVAQVFGTERSGDSFCTFFEPFLDFVSAVEHVFKTFECRASDDIRSSLKLVTKC